MKYILISFFILLNTLLYYVVEKNVDQVTRASQESHIHKLQVHYETFLKTQSMSADVIFASVVQKKEIKESLKALIAAKSKKEQEVLRNRLYKELLPEYKVIKEGGVLQLHFVSQDNRALLRMHKPSKFGDDLSFVRQDIAWVNTTHQPFKGFSQGRIAHAFRNAYPIFDDEKNYICAVEISYPSELLQKNLNTISQIPSQFLVNKHVFDTKAWMREDLVLRYTLSSLSDDYILTQSSINFEKLQEFNIELRLESIKEKVSQLLEKGEKFAVESTYNGEVVVSSFIPIVQKSTGSVAAWIVSYEFDQLLTQVYKNSYLVKVFGTVLIFLLALVFYIIWRQKTKLNEIVTRYDKNVIFSTTDIYGKITHVSEAFCRLSGYSKEQLVGKPHSLIRHPDMPKEFFAELWSTIAQKKRWSGEVKNLRQDGSFYWVEAEIEPILHNGELVGYSSIRQDITNRKELDTIQKDIIFTMGAIGENRSVETGNHVKRVALYSKLFAKLYGLNDDEVETLYQASPMHDIGKIAIPDAILNKPAALSNEEMNIMKTHAQKGYEMLSVSSRPLLQSAAIVAYHHHENWDGSGYPRGLMRDEIHVFGRITAIADVFDALASKRCYKDAWSDEDIFAYIKEQSGKQFEPKLVELFFNNLESFLEIRERLQ